MSRKSVFDVRAKWLLEANTRAACTRWHVAGDGGGGKGEGGGSEQQNTAAVQSFPQDREYVCLINVL